MSIQYVNLGSNPNDGTGDDLRTAFLKVNDNFQLLSTIGGETNYGTNLGGGDGEVYAGKTLEVLNFRTIAAGTGITVNQDGTTITIASSFSPPASITKVYDQNNTLYETATPGASLKIKGSGFVSTQLNGNEMTINGAFSVVQDQTPLLGGNLDLNGFNVTGLGNISNTGSITTDTLTVGRSTGIGNYPGVATIAGTLTVNGATSLAALSATSITTSSGITAQSFTTTSGIFTGDLHGDTTGTHYGDVAIKGLGINPDVIVINTAASPAVITGSHFGDFSGSFTGQLIGPGIDMNNQSISGFGTISLDGVDNPNNMVLTVNGYYHGGDIPLNGVPEVTQGAGSTLLNMRQQTFGLSEALRLRSTSLNSDQIMPLGTGIRFESVNVTDINDPTYQGHTPLAPEYMLHGYVGLLNYQHGLLSTSDCSTFIVKARTGDTVVENYLRDVIVARGDGNVTVSDTQINSSIISPRTDEFSGTLGTIPYDLVLTNENPSHYINFYGSFDPAYPDEGRATGLNGTGYSFPKTIGAPGEVLTAQAGTNLLVWSLPGGGGGGGGATSLLNLSDVPDTYSGSAGKLLRVNSTNTGVEFVNAFSATVTGSLIGNASTATALQTPRTFNGFAFDGTQNIVIDTRQIEELKQAATNASVAGSGGTLVTTANIQVMESNLTVNAGESSWNQGARKFRTGMVVKGTGINNPVITNISVFGGSSPTPQNDRIVQLTVTFESQVVNTQTGLSITGEVANQWFNETKARTVFSVTPGSALSYTSATGVFTLDDSVASSGDTLVKRNSSGYVYLNKAYVSTLEKNSGDTAITIASPVSTSSTITSSANITTSGTVSTGFITLTGTGNQTLASTAQLILNPGTYVDVSGKKITNLSTVAPTNNSDAATKKYVDDTTGAVQSASFQALKVTGNATNNNDLISLAKNDTLTVLGTGNIVSSTTATGVQLNLKSTISGITIDGNLPVSGNLTGATVKGGNIKLEGNTVLQTVTGSDLNLIPGSTGGSVVISDTDFKLVNSRLSMTGFDVMEFSKNTLSQQVSLVTQTTFIRTISWTDDGAGLAFAELPNGQSGQIKIIIMSDRGTYGNALDTRPRHLVLSGNINGSSRTVNIAAVDANGSSTFIFLNNYWWRIANVA